MKGQPGSISARISDDPGMSSTIDTDSESLSDGTTTLNFNGQRAKYIDFQIQLETTGDKTKTPSVDSVELSYSTTPPNQDPVISDPNPNNQSTTSPGTVTVSAEVNDNENDPIVVEFYEGQAVTGSPDKTVTLSSGGPSRPDYDVNGAGYGTTHWWTVFAHTQGNRNKNDTKKYVFDINNNPSPVIDNP